MSKRINLVCAHLVHQRTGELLRGGAERYTIELARLLRDQGRHVRIIHKAVRDFVTTIDGVEVVGLAVPSGALGNPFFSRKAARAVAAGDLQIYVLAELAFPCLAHPAIGVQHGVWWESDYPAWKRWINDRIQASLAHRFDAYVCVDTCFINWLYAQARGRCQYAHKLWYVPNFPFAAPASPVLPMPSSEPLILFPRRIEFFRGAMLFYAAMKEIWSQGRNYRARFCGDGVLLAELQHIVQNDGFSAHCSFVSAGMEDMASEYQRADVVVIPTVAREGTSLSCIEAMAFGRPVVTTHVGGLGNLVIPGHNGLMVDLRAGDLAAAIVRATEDTALRQHLVANGVATAQALSMDSWRNRWTDVINSVLHGDKTPSVFPHSGRTTGTLADLNFLD